MAQCEQRAATASSRYVGGFVWGIMSRHSRK